MIKDKNRKILFFIFLCIFLFSIIYIFVSLYTTYKDTKDINKIQKYMSISNDDNLLEKNNEFIETNGNITKDETIEKPVETSVDEDILRFQEIKKLNSNIVAWIEIKGTNINYPILQGKDNEYYLNRNYKNEYSQNGSIFLDYRYDFSKENCNFLVYGHNNKNNLMFSELLEYRNEKFFENHKEINIITQNEKKKYNIIAIFKSQVFSQSDENVFRYYNCIEFPNEDAYYDYIKKCKENSIYDIDIETVYGDEIITLSTCEYSKENGRFVVVAVKEK